ncbi:MULTISPECIES: CoA-acylating methylmalonate-semialdehyde dehydrogenase [Pseudonocardia]|uniref:methylmalonate-semialdehyde dehydrogenase (CoA acylating) n=2 Tax=Pseudonocardia TaxID=1847 RepID=A0A1Y2N9C0_PSEAH|nr:MULTISPECIES: CoA-acylating methylmalonate-semialdehyde dehydrogenase [Pseudonocardia]OSY44062.1 Methylmalonate-semialdehyde dehydrogenase [acylating] [Pseudonocardia autotrophica]TDN74208.1 malonate-semialdehyde dehydrogenase (acetylating)/methylmalonate-semialdehyde dehydrogenase [Pseudonocardia autotrophica]BBG04968.1 putative methylmalonic acid semialdehyde dehydrogenase MmsA [Pseudonocardia autotrophica]GEC23624.1 putative methylmalonic acid semialdehyde dehydrogenase MmsA [Pseudonocard
MAAIDVLEHRLSGKPWSGSSERFSDVYDPNRGTARARVRLADESDVDEVVRVAVEAQREWAAWNPQRRARVLLRFLQLANQHHDELAALLSAEHGKTLPDARGDIQRGLEVIEFAAGAPHLLKGEYSTDAGGGIDVYSMRQPLGVVAAITPFNFPAMIPLWKLGPALACGNAVVLKPSERDPSVPIRIAELFDEAGLPPGVLTVLHGDKVAVDALLVHPDIQAVGFVGSTPIAQYVYATATAHGKRAQCFGGAKNHLIVMPDADLDQAADAISGAAFGSAGQRCMAVSVAVPVGEQTADALVAKLAERARNLTIGRSDSETADLGPLVGADAAQRVTAAIAAGAEEGAELVVDGRGITPPDGGEGGWFVGGTLFDRVTTDMSLYRDEIFGPVLSVVRAADYEQALRLPNENVYGNGVSIFTRDGDAARNFAARVNTGMVGVNVPIPVPIAYHTFGGWKASGFGDLNQHGPDSFKFYTRTKTVTSRWPSGIKDGASFVIPTMS